jgi:hypothetical protein
MSKHARALQQIRVIGAIVILVVSSRLVGGARAMEPPAPPQPSATDSGAQAQYQIGLVFERSGRFAEAEAAFSKAIAEGSDRTRHAALQALDRVILARESAGAELQSRLGEIYEREGRLTDAELAYTKALQDGPPAMRAEALRRLHAVVERRRGISQTYLAPIAPAWAAFVTAALALAFALLLVTALRYPLDAFGRWRGRDTLTILAFTQSSGAEAIGGTLTGVLEAMHERMAVHFRQRAALSNRPVPALAQSQSAELVALVSTVGAPAVPFVSWLVRRFRQPAYRVSGSVGSTALYVNVLARLEHAGATVARWNRTIPVDDWFTREQDLAYDILLTLKAYVDGHASRIDQPGSIRARH